LQNLYHVLDGRRAVTPCDEVDPLTVPESQKLLVPAKVFRTVAENLRADPKTRARFMVIASTGVRPVEVRRSRPEDVDLDRRVWTVRTAKGGAARAIWLNDEMLVAWKFFFAVGAFGHFDGSDYAKALYAAGWPKHFVTTGKKARAAVRPY